MARRVKKPWKTSWGARARDSGRGWASDVGVFQGDGGEGWMGIFIEKSTAHVPSFVWLADSVACGTSIARSSARSVVLGMFLRRG